MEEIRMRRRFAIKFLSLIPVIPIAAAAQSAPPRKDIPTIAKAANGAIVTIITATNDKPIAQGTGFLVSADGVIVTNYHVIETGNVAVVKFPDDTAFLVDGVLATDKVRDLAIIKIHGKPFRTLALGDSDDIQVGEEVVAIGNPLSLESTVSNGIISGVRTSKEQGGKFLQTTAPISPGSSGGPLFNMRGDVVGINTLYLEGGENLNFAIPINEAKNLLASRSTKLTALPNEPESRETHKQDEAAPSFDSTQPRPNPPDRDLFRAQTARYYFDELKNTGAFNRYSDEYACFAHSDAPSFAVMSTTDSILQRMKRSGESISRAMAQEMKGGLSVQTYFKGVANKVIIYDEEKNTEGADHTYSIEFGSPFHGKMVYQINWTTGRYRLKVLAANKAVPASEAAGQCELIHPEVPVRDR
jgi:hypothetical protein